MALSLSSWASWFWCSNGSNSSMIRFGKATSLHLKRFYHRTMVYYFKMSLPDSPKHFKISIRLFWGTKRVLNFLLCVFSRELLDLTQSSYINYMKIFIKHWVYSRFRKEMCVHISIYIFNTHGQKDQKASLIIYKA